jgi:transcriptional regulator GlxA family with amidase domain
MKSQKSQSVVRVAIVLPERVWAGSVYLVKELLLIAGTLLTRKEDLAASALFQVSLAASSRAPVPSLSGVPILPDTTLKSLAHCDVVIVPPQYAPRGETTAGESGLAAWIAKQHKNGALIISLNGAILLAKTGLLDHKQATGLRSEKAIFAHYFPTVRFTPSRRIVVNDQIICAGGVNPTVDICAHIIERFFGQSASRKFQHYTTTDALPGQEQLAVWSAQFKQHKDQQVLSVQSMIENSLAHIPSAFMLAASVHLSERTLSRRFVAAVGTNIRKYTTNCRLEMARRLLRTTNDPLSLIANECGFGSTSALIHAFQASYGVSPVCYRREIVAQLTPSTRE